METVAFVVRYVFVAALAVEAVLIARALIGLAREKARATVVVPTTEE